MYMLMQNGRVHFKIKKLRKICGALNILQIDRLESHIPSW